MKFFEINEINEKYVIKGILLCACCGKMDWNGSGQAVCTL
jgi:hypothetical protein